jgi:hypothetical protein
MLFDQHQGDEHDLMSFLELITRVQSMRQADLNGTEFYVSKMLDESSLEWFPIEKSSRVKSSLDQVDAGERVENLHSLIADNHATMSESIRDIAMQLGAMRSAQEDVQVRLAALERIPRMANAVPAARAAAQAL